MSAPVLNPRAPSMLAGVFPATRTDFPPFVVTLPPGPAQHLRAVAAFGQGTPGSTENRRLSPKFPSTLPAANAPALRATHLHSDNTYQAGSKTPTRPNTARESCDRITRASSDTEDCAPASPGIYGANIMARQNRSYRGTLAATGSQPIPEMHWKWPARVPHKPWLATDPPTKEWCAAPNPARVSH